jgi:hypothetical protein
VSAPRIERNGDTWSLAWPDQGVAMGLERLHESRDELRAEVVVESTVAGRVLGPVRLNILSSESQSRFATTCATRVNGMDKEHWLAIVVQACAVVAKQFREPSPTLNLATDVDTSGGVEYLVPLVLPLGETIVLYGDGESAKSLLALRIGVSVALGQILPWGERPSKRCPVLYLDWETNPKTVATRLRRLSMGMRTGTPGIFYRQCFRGLEDELPSIREEIDRRGIGLVIVDSIGYAATGSLVEDDTARRATNALRQMSPATRLVVAHVSAEGARQTSGTASPFGSRFFWNGMRSGLELRRAEESSRQDEIRVGLFHRKANDGEHHAPIGMDVMFDGPLGAIEFVESDVFEAPDLAARTPLSTQLRRLLRKGEATIADLADECDATEETIGRTLRRMSDVVRLSEGARGRPASWGLSAQ